MPIELGSFSLGTVVGGVVVGVFNHYLTKSRNTEERRIKEFNQAAATFRSKVLSILEGFYPVIHSLAGSDYTKIRETIPKVESIAAEFNHFLDGSTKREFNETVKGYCDYCKALNRENDHARAMFNHPSSPKPETEPLNTEILARHVDNLLSFAKER